MREAADGLIDQARQEVAPAVRQFYEVVGRPVAELEEHLAQIMDERTRLESDLERVRSVSVEALETIAQNAGGGAPS